MTDENSKSTEEGRDAAPVAADPTPQPPVEPTPEPGPGVMLPPDQIQPPTGAVTEQEPLGADETAAESDVEEAHDLPEQVEPEDVPNGGE